MNRFSDLVSIAARSVGNLSPYFSNEAPDPSLIRLDSNENPFGPSLRALEAMHTVTASAHLYPDDNCWELRRTIADHHEVAVEQVLVTPGSSGMLSLLCQALLGPGLNAVTSERSFIVYGMVVKAAGGRLIETPMRGDEFDLDGILRAINKETRLVFLANPNNPTGTMMDAPAIDEFLGRIPEYVIVVLDEAYYEFATAFAARKNINYSSSLECVRRGANVVVLRTFSKVHGLAGLRIGYGVGPAELLGYSAHLANTYSVASISQAAALAAIDDQQHIERTVANNTEQAGVLGDGLVDLGFRVVPTWANFLYCDVGREADRLVRQLRAQGISVRPLAAWGAQQCLRISIGTAVQNAALLESLRRIRRQGQ
jgi:histidinol-phosphate aminotransferase